jgi:ring-1,2-phenylacetyl-CoA epoxidase subunit PaaD
VNVPVMSTDVCAPVAVASVAAPAESWPTIGAVWQALAAVPDPEIPAVSIVELGILRCVAWDAGDSATVVVTVTPTYSGCPATELIMTSIRDALTAVGVARVRLEIELAPAWTTEWITLEGRRKLREFGIAPPDGTRAASNRATIDVAGISPLRRARVAVTCPRCGSNETRLLSQFGSTACKAQYRCLACLEPFDYFKPH